METTEQSIVYTDELTELKNRRYFERLLPEVTKKVSSGVFIVFDVDDFKRINDTYGHIIGDRALKVVGESIQKIFSSLNSHCIRYAGDEFVVFIEEISEKDVPSLIISLFESIKGMVIPSKQGDRKVNITFSAGISLFPEDAQDIHILFELADQALYFVKRKGKNNFAFFKDVEEKIRKESILQGYLTPKKFIGHKKIFQEPLNILNRQKGILIVEGETGSGKSRFLREISKECEKRNLDYIYLNCDESLRETPLGVFIRTFNLWLDQEKTKVLRANGFDDLSYFFPILRGNKGAKPPISRVIELFNFVLKNFSPVFLIDDIHFLDEISISFLSKKAIESEGIFIMTSLESEISSELLGTISRIKIEHFKEEEIYRYVSSLFPEIERYPEFISWLTRASKGIPFFIEEILRFLIERDILIVRKEGFSLREDFDFNQIPPVEQVLQMRIKTLEPELRKFLRALSSVGRYFDIRTISKFTRMNEGRVQDFIDQARKAHIIEHSEEDVFFFLNESMRKTLYRGISEDSKKRLHSRIAEIISEIKNLPMESILGDLVHHYKNAGEQEKALKLSDRMTGFARQFFERDDIRKLLEIRKRRKTKAEIPRPPPPDAGVLQEVDSFTRRLWGVIEALRLYPENSKIVQENLNGSFNILNRIVQQQGSITLAVAQGKLVCEGMELPSHRTLFHQKLIELMDNFKIQSFTFTRDVNPNDFKNFVEIFKLKRSEIEKEDSIEEILEKRNLQGVYIDERMFVAIGDELESFKDMDIGKLDEVKDTLRKMLERVPKDKEELPTYFERFVKYINALEPEELKNIVFESSPREEAFHQFVGKIPEKKIYSLRDEMVKEMKNRETQGDLDGVLKAKKMLSIIDKKVGVPETPEEILKEILAIEPAFLLKEIKIQQIIELIPYLEKTGDTRNLEKILNKLNINFEDNSQLVRKQTFFLLTRLVEKIHIFEELKYQIYSMLIYAFTKEQNPSLKDEEVGVIKSIVHRLIKKGYYSEIVQIIPELQKTESPILKDITRDVISSILNNKERAKESKLLLLEVPEIAIDTLQREFKDNPNSAVLFKELAERKLKDLKEHIINPDMPETFLVSALKILIDKKPQIDTKFLIPFLEHSVPLIRALSLSALYSVSPKFTKSHLIKALEDPDEKVKTTAIRLSGQLKVQESLPVLISFIEKSGKFGTESGENLQRAVLQHLKNFPEEDILDVLIDFVQSEGTFSTRKTKPLSLRVEALKVLKNFKENPYVQEKLTPLKKEKSAVIRNIVSEILTK